MPSRKAGGKKRKRHAETYLDAVEEKESRQDREDKENVDDAAKERSIVRDNNALVDLVFKKYKQLEAVSSHSEPAVTYVAESGGSPLNSAVGDGAVSRVYGSDHQNKENVGEGNQTAGPVPRRCSKRVTSRKGTSTPDGGPGVGKSGSETASFRKRTGTSVSSTKSTGTGSHHGTLSSKGHRLHTPEPSSSPGQHSTPYPARREKESLHDSLFGFENLESPLVLAPLVLSPVRVVSDCHEADRPARRCPDHHWHTPGTITTICVGPKRNKSRKKAPEPSEQDEWIKKMNEEFSHIDAYDLVIQ